MAPTFTTEEGAAFDCPFCGLTVDVGKTDDDNLTVVHGIPPCEKFLSLPVDRFLEEATKEMQRRQKRYSSIES
jgi:hypothetical protein